MNMKKKIFCALILVLFIAGISHTLEKRILRLGLLSKLNSSEEEFSETWKKTFAPNNEALEVRIRFYDSLTALQMGLNASEISQIVLPDFAADYIMTQNNAYESTLVLRSHGMGLAFGFREDSQELRRKFNEALSHLRSNWTLSALEGMYIASRGNDFPEPVKFAHFDNAPVIRAAVTGDLPPIDLIAPDGQPAGFNTAVLAEIGNYLHVNIELVDIDAGARTAALASGRADVVFWYEVDTSGSVQPDVPDGVILSEPYYEWSKYIHVRKAENKKNASRGWSITQSILDLYWR